MNKIPNEDQFEFVEIGEISLRGKASFVTLFTSQRLQDLIQLSVKFFHEYPIPEG